MTEHKNLDTKRYCITDKEASLKKFDTDDKQGLDKYRHKRI